MKHPIYRLFWSMAFPLFFLMVLTAIQTLKTNMGWDFTHLGIYPLMKEGLFGVFAHPLIHTSWLHLIYNAIPLFVLSTTLYYYYHDSASTILLAVWLIGGLLTWFIGKPGWHLGASGLVYSLAFFLLSSGLLQKQWIQMGAAALVFAFYGNMIIYMLPWFAKTNISWEGHLDGAIAGILLAIVLFYRSRRDSLAQK